MSEVDRGAADAENRQLADYIDALITRRPRWGRYLPAVFFTGVGASQIIAAYQHRVCPPPNHRLVPHAHITDEELARIGEDDIALFDMVGTRLRETMPDGMHMPSLDNLQLVLDVLKIEAHGANTRDKIDDLGEKLYDKHRTHRRDQEEAAKLAKDSAKILINSTPASPLSSLVDVADHTFRAKLFSRYRFGLKRTRHYQWFINEIGKPNNSFLGAALDLVQGGAKRHDRQLVSHLLMLALLRDLAKATRPRPFMPWYYRHTTPFVLLFEHVGAGDDAAKRFITTFFYARRKLNAERVLGFRRASVAHSPVLLLGALDAKFPDLPHHREFRSVGNAASYLSELSKRQRGALQAFTIHLRDAAPDFISQLRHGTRLRPKKRWLKGFAPSVALLCVLGLGILAGDTLLDTTRPCRMVGNERIGLNMHGECKLLSLKKISDQERQVETDIIAQNKKADRDLHDDEGKRLVTIAAFIPFTNSDGSVNEGNLNQLRAVALAQQEANETSKDKRVKVIIANPGHELSQAKWVANLICKQVSDHCSSDVRRIRTGKDTSIAGVVGISESRAPGTFDALQVFTDARLPVVASSITASTILDDTYQGQGKDDNYTYDTTYHITPSNPRQALIVARFAKQQLHARHAIVIAPEGDEYGLDVARYFEQFFAQTSGETHTVLARYGIQKDKASVPSSALQEYYEQFVTGKKENIFAAICRDPDFDPAKDIVYFAGRADDFDDMTADLAVCGASKLTVLGGSDMTRVEEARATVDLYYASFSALADEDIAAHAVVQPVGSAVTSSQLTHFQQKYRNNYSEPTDFSNPARAYDAFQALWRLVGQVDVTKGPVYQAVLGAAKSSTHAMQFPGATGYIDMGKGTHISPARPIFIIKKPASTGDALSRQVSLVCGRFNNQGRQGYVEVTGWKFDDGTTFSCP